MYNNIDTLGSYISLKLPFFLPLFLPLFLLDIKDRKRRRYVCHCWLICKAVSWRLQTYVIQMFTPTQYTGCLTVRLTRQNLRIESQLQLMRVTKSNIIISLMQKRTKKNLPNMGRRQKDGLAGNRTPDHSHAKGVLYH